MKADNRRYINVAGYIRFSCDIDIGDEQFLYTRAILINSHKVLWAILGLTLMRGMPNTTPA